LWNVCGDYESVTLFAAPFLGTGCCIGLRRRLAGELFQTRVGTVGNSPHESLLPRVTNHSSRRQTLASSSVVRAGWNEPCLQRFQHTVALAETGDRRIRDPMTVRVARALLRGGTATFVAETGTESKVRFAEREYHEYDCGIDCGVGRVGGEQRAGTEFGGWHTRRKWHAYAALPARRWWEFAWTSAEFR